jgi:hypothetical protein
MKKISMVCLGGPLDGTVVAHDWINTSFVYEGGVYAANKQHWVWTGLSLNRWLKRRRKLTTSSRPSVECPQ